MVVRVNLLVCLWFCVLSHVFLLSVSCLHLENRSDFLDAMIILAPLQFTQTGKWRKYALKLY